MERRVVAARRFGHKSAADDFPSGRCDGTAQPPAFTGPPALARLHDQEVFMRSLNKTTAPLLGALTLAAAFSGAALAQSPVTLAPGGRPSALGPRAAGAPAAAAGQGNAVVATVNGEPIRISDISAAAASLPPEVRQQVPQDVIFGKLIDQLISKKALVIEAKKEGLDKDPAVQKQMAAAADQVLQVAILQKEVLPKINEEAIKALYDQDVAHKAPETEVHARHILVDSEAKAKDIIAQLKAGAKFEDLAKKYGDPKDAATQQGGDLGFFKKGDMLPEFSAAAFKLKPNEYTQTPIHTRYGWHVIQVLETRTAQPPTYDQVHDELKQKLQKQDVEQAVAQARAQVKVVQYNPDGTPVKPASASAPVKK
jgi:peptidyl-prolyl cis-trans isomerase C